MYSFNEHKTYCSRVGMDNGSNKLMSLRCVHVYLIDRDLPYHRVPKALYRAVLGEGLVFSLMMGGGIRE